MIAQAYHHVSPGLPKINGEAEQQPLETKDTGKVDDSVEASTSSATAEATMRTPATKKGTANSGSSKKKAAVPEHKSKKLNKKKSRPLTNLDGE